MGLGHRLMGHGLVTESVKSAVSRQANCGIAHDRAHDDNGQDRAVDRHHDGGHGCEQAVQQNVDELTRNGLLDALCRLKARKHIARMPHLEPRCGQSEQVPGNA
ncbi:hypothetical protein D9M69_421650 [compost metagenome]